MAPTRTPCATAGQTRLAILSLGDTGAAEGVPSVILWIGAGWREGGMQSTRARDKSVLPFPSPSLEEILMSRFGFRIDDDHPFIVLTETKFSSRCIPVWICTLLTGLGSEKKHM